MSTVTSTQRPAKYDDEYASCASTYATLRVYTGQKPPETVTSALGIEPTEVYVRDRNRARLNGWMLSSKDRVTSRDVRRHVDWLLEQLRAKRSKLLSLQTETDVWMDVFCYWNSAQGQGGPSLNAEQMRELAELNLGIGFDCYFT